MLFLRTSRQSKYRRGNQLAEDWHRQSSRGRLGVQMAQSGGGRSCAIGRDSSANGRERYAMLFRFNSALFTAPSTSVFCGTAFENPAGSYRLSMGCT